MDIDRATSDFLTTSLAASAAPAENTRPPAYPMPFNARRGTLTDSSLAALASGPSSSPLRTLAGAGCHCAVPPCRAAA
jgi:hypothetical protein